ncbi:MAG: tetratricopeptide repeat protein [Hydrogenophaga sp.]|nr:tetratricopeptide repeat protein [Hydrogenophaga sp.]
MLRDIRVEAGSGWRWAVAGWFALACGACAAAAGETVEQALQAAQQAARTHRHAEAIAAYERAQQLAPHRRKAWRVELADHWLWHGHPARAERLYREVLADGFSGAADGLDGATDGPAHPAGASRVQRRVHMGLGRALAWQGRHRAALVAFEQVLQFDPTDREARIEHARVNAWRGRHRVAAAALQGVLVDHPGDREATHRLAEVWAWMDRSDRAGALLASHVGRDPQDTVATEALVRHRRAQRPQVTADFRRFTQSDGLDIADLQGRLEAADPSGIGRWGVRLGRARFLSPTPGEGGLAVQRLALDGRAPLGEAVSVAGTVGRERIEGQGVGGVAARSLHRWTHDLQLRVQPSDPWRLTLGSTRWTFDSLESLRTGLTARETRGVLELLPDDVHRASLQWTAAAYSDGNARRSMHIQVQRRLHRWPEAMLGLRHASDDFRRPGQPGYFNPDRLRSAHLTLDLRGDFGAAAPALQWQWMGSVGVEQEPMRASRPVRSARVQITGAIGPDLALEVAYDHSTSRIVDRDGFARGIARFSVRQRF